MTKTQAWIGRLSGAMLGLGGFGLAVRESGPAGSDGLVIAGLVLIVFGSYTVWKAFGKIDE